MRRLRFNVRFFVQKIKGASVKKDETGYLMCRVRWLTYETVIGVGCVVNFEKWDKEQQMAVRGTTHTHKGKSVQASEINRLIQNLTDAVADSFAKFDLDGIIPSRDALRSEVVSRLGYAPEMSLVRKEAAKTTIKNNESIFGWLDVFLDEGNRIHHWAVETTNKFLTMKAHLFRFDPKLTFATLDSDKMKSFQAYLTDQKLRNVTVQKLFQNFRWFLRWCYNRKEPLITDRSVVAYKCTLKDVEHKEIVFLTWEEFQQLYKFDIPEPKQYLERVRDLFVFACTTGLRYSDVAALTRQKVKDDEITVVTEKTDDVIRIHLNKYSREVLQKYHNVPFKKNLALPIISNQNLNGYLKELGQLAGINSPVTIAYRRGSRKYEEVKPKFEVLSFHAGRRTYVSLALKLGATPEEVSRVSGHHSYQIMQRYMAQDDEQRKHATSVFDERTERDELMELVTQMSNDELRELLSERIKQ